MIRLVSGTVALVLAGSAMAGEPVLMSPEWGAEACRAWNQDEVLTVGLAESGWIANDKGRGFKIMQVYRSDCSDAPTVELRVSLREGKAECVYGGAIGTDKLDGRADYVMHASTERWQQMGAGEYGPMKAMMLGRLKFAGPYGEAMGNMGPFKNFLLLVGKVPASAASCPAEPAG
jgi:putative sterol carrier protein